MCWRKPDMQIGDVLWDTIYQWWAMKTNTLKIQACLSLWIHPGIVVVLMLPFLLAAEERGGRRDAGELGGTCSSCLGSTKNSPNFHCCPLHWAFCHQPIMPQPTLTPSSLRVYLWRAVMSLLATEQFCSTLYPNQPLHFSQVFSLFLNSFFLLIDSLFPLQLILFHFFSFTVRKTLPKCHL